MPGIQSGLVLLCASFGPRSCNSSQSRLNFWARHWLWPACPHNEQLRTAVSSRSVQYSRLHILQVSGRRFWILTIRLLTTKSLLYSDCPVTGNSLYPQGWLCHTSWKLFYAVQSLRPCDKVRYSHGRLHLVLQHSEQQGCLPLIWGQG